MQEFSMPLRHKRIDYRRVFLFQFSLSPKEPSRVRARILGQEFMLFCCHICHTLFVFHCLSTQYNPSFILLPWQIVFTHWLDLIIAAISFTCNKIFLGLNTQSKHHYVTDVTAVTVKIKILGNARARVREKTSTLGFHFYFAKEKEKKQHHFTHKLREINFHQLIFL